MDSKDFLIYIAGIFDNCGYISLKKDGRSKKSVFLHISFKSKKEDILKLIKENYGGTLRRNKKSYTLIITHKKAKILLKELEPYLITKKEEVKLLLEFFNQKFYGEIEEKRKNKLLKDIIVMLGLSDKNIKNKKWSIKSLLED